ncbi:hypothetical protein [Naasia lichenicola]|uniref:Uncharacterized protein n=1 Tax=Naasia lichenicola TaxID=2565933 RepID=A0A4S4FUA4_9MICO|nr:hypothetical protein [Naasia lichenicola]THG33385.1 hypothetical protein E6C64_03275 [Naasia lichenicola]
MSEPIAPSGRGSPALLTSKVPQISVLFWVGFGLSLTTIIVGALFPIALAVQFATRRYAPVVYWLTVVLISLVGTLITDNLGVIAIAFFVFKANAVVCFWAAYIMTRPLGASIGDLTSAPTADGGLGLGYTITSVVLAAVIVALVAHLSVRLAAQRRQVQGSAAAAAATV